MVGKTLSHYRITEKLGEGGMGEVYRAQDTKLPREVAIKVLPEHLAGDPERRMRFEREAAAIASLKHPSIVTIYSVEEADGLHFITMELVEGATLGDHIKPDGLPLDQLFKMAIPLADAISSAHAKGIAHRDLKPANIMIDTDGRLKVLDFGLAKLFETDIETDETISPDSDTGQGRIMGTVSYMSPEQAEGKQVDHRSDIFTLGIILYQMATGQRPFKGETNMSTLSSIIKDTPASVTDIRATLPVHLGRIVKRCLAKEPDRRYQSALDVRNELDELRSEVATGETIEVTGQYAPATARRRRGIGRIVGVASTAVVLVAAAVFLVPKLGGRDGGEAPAPSVETASLNSIAVLPFANMSGVADNEYFSDGLAEELLNLLAKVSGLRVAARTSSFHFKGQTGNVKEIGERLGVATILEGSVRRSGDRVRVTAQLVKAADGFHMWSETYDRNLDDIFAIQEDIATRVVEALKITLLGEDAARLAKRPTESIEAYDAYLLGLERIKRRRSDSLQEAVDYFQRAVDLDPSFALAYVGLAEAYSHLEEYGSMSIEESQAHAVPAIVKALTLDGKLGEAWAVRGLLKFDLGDPSAREDFEKAIELSPNFVMGHMWLSLIIGPADRTARWKAINKALELDPLSPVVNVNIGFWKLDEGEAEEAIARFKHVIEIDPGFTAAYRGLARAYQQALGQPEEALKWYEKAAETDPGNLHARLNIVELLYDLGRVDDAVETVEAAIAQDPGFASAYAEMGDIHRAEGRFDEAVRWQLRAAERDPDNLWVQVGMVFAYLNLNDRANAEKWLEKLASVNPGSPQVEFLRSRIDVFNGDLEAANARIRDLVSKSEVAAGWFADDAIEAAVSEGRGADAKRIASRSYPMFFGDDDPRVNGANVWEAIQSAMALKANGEEDRASRLLEKADAYFSELDLEYRTNANPFLLAVIYGLQERDEEALQEVERLFAAGKRGGWWDFSHPAAARLREDPRLKKLIAEVRREVDELRRNLAAEGLATP